MAVAHRIYAEALLEAATEKGRLDRVRDEFDSFAAALADAPGLGDLLRNPQIDSTAKGEALHTVLGGADPVFLNFLRLTAEKGRIGELAEIYTEWQRLLAAQERILSVELTTAVELSAEEAAGIVKQIEEAAGRKVEATRVVDPELIGGLVLRAGSMRVDGSVRGRLETLREELLAAG
jgi:F-type H+-transporting ATPase subunit delta